MTSERDQTISDALQKLDVAMGNHEPPQPEEMWSRLQFCRRYRPRVDRESYSATRNDALVAACVAACLLIKVSPGWVSLSLICILTLAIATAVLLWLYVSRTIGLTDRE
jgi:hypothetical protein